MCAAAAALYTLLGALLLRHSLLRVFLRAADAPAAGVQVEADGRLWLVDF